MLARKGGGSQPSGSSAVGRACLVAAHGLRCLPAMELQPAAELLAEIFRARSEDMIQSRTAEESRRRARMASSVISLSKVTMNRILEVHVERGWIGGAGSGEASLPAPEFHAALVIGVEDPHNAPSPKGSGC